ncbi:MAG: hypothetical protein ABEJ30_02090 [Halorientalis sp.]
MTRTVPFSVLDEAAHALGETFEPWNIQIEVWTDETVDLDRLREAAVTAADAHPLARARRQPSSLTDSGHTWEIPDAVGSVPVAEADGDDLAATRARFYGERFDLTAEPPVRLLVVRGGGVDGGDALLCSVDHAAADGLGALRIARSVCRAYRGEPLDGDPVGLEESRAELERFTPSSVGDGLSLADFATRTLGNAFDEPTRIAQAGDSDREGWGFVFRTLDDDLAERVVHGRPGGATVNDAFLAALHLAIAEWNERHGDPAGKISTMMPVNLRPDGWEHDVVGMFASFERVETRPRHRRTPRTTVEAVADQTAERKQPDRAAAAYGLLRLIPPGTPVGLTDRLPDLLRGPGGRVLDSAVLSNLGRLPDPPSLSGGDGDAVWFSPPCISPVPVGMGVATGGGAIRLSLRHTFEQFDASAAADFADCYLTQLGRTVE